MGKGRVEVGAQFSTPHKLLPYEIVLSLGIVLTCFCGMQSVSNGSALKGGAFWAWYDEGQVGPEGEGGGDGLFGVRDTSSTFDLVRSNARGLAG